jgi:hypothetical protein
VTSTSPLLSLVYRASTLTNFHEVSRAAGPKWTGYNIVNGSPVPKAVAEFLNFKGDGTLTSLATLSVNGNIVQHDAAGTGSYAINQDCTGTLTFSPSGLTFDLFIAPNGSRFHMIETVTGTVLAGSARRVAR